MKFFERFEKLGRLNINRHSAFFLWFIFSIVTVLIFAALNIPVQSITNKMLLNEINKSNMAKLSEIKTVTDKQIQLASSMSLQVASLPSVAEISSYSLPLSNFQVYEMSKLSETLKSYGPMSNNTNITYIVFKSLNLIVSSRGVMPPDVFFDAVYTTPAEYGSWVETWNQTERRGFITFRGISPDTEDLIAVCPVDTNDFVNTIVCSVVTGESFMNMTLAKIAENERLFLTDKDKNIILSASKPEFTKEELYELTNGGYFRASSVKYIINIQPSAYSKWNYVYASPEYMYMATYKNVRNISFGSNILFILLGCFASFFIAQYNYKPIKSLMNSIKTQSNYDFEKGNEFQAITKAINKITSDNRSLETGLHRLSRPMRNHFLLKLLKNRNDTDLYEDLKNYEISFIGSKFVVACFVIENIDEFATGFEIKDIAAAYQTGNFIINNIAEELIRQKNNGYMTEDDNSLFLIMNFDMSDDTRIFAETREILNYLKEFVYSNFNIVFSVSVSGIKDGLDEINAAYTECCDAILYRFILGTGSLIFQNDILASDEYSFNYRTDTEYSFINAIKSGNYDESSKRLADIIESNRQSAQSPGVIKFLMINIVSSLIKALNDIDANKGGNFLSAVNPFLLLEINTLEELENKIQAILKNVCSFIENKKNSSKPDFIKKLQEYIHENYNDVNLSVTSLSDAFSINSTSLSKLFKEFTGETPHDYIIAYRHQKSKEFLLNTNMSIKETSLAVGYFNTNTFIRQFKSFEGVTPGIFKEEHKKENF